MREGDEDGVTRRGERDGGEANERERWGEKERETGEGEEKGSDKGWEGRGEEGGGEGSKGLGGEVIFGQGLVIAGKRLMSKHLWLLLAPASSSPSLPPSSSLSTSPDACHLFFPPIFRYLSFATHVTPFPPHAIMSLSCRDASRPHLQNIANVGGAVCIQPRPGM